MKVIAATALLHNICEYNYVPIPQDAPPNLDDNPDDDLNPIDAAENRNDGARVRNAIVRDYFL